MRTRTWVSLAIAGVVAAVAASGAERLTERATGSTSTRPPVALDTHAMNAMLRADRDKDGVLSREELEYYDLTLARRFKEADTDRDGKLTLYEFEKIFASPETSASR